MKYGLTVVSAPAEEPVSSEEIVNELRLVGNDADRAVVSSKIVAAREYFEARTGRQLISAQYLFVINQWPDTMQEPERPLGWRYGTIRLPKAPLQTVDLIQYKDWATGVLTTLAITEYQVSALREPGMIAPARYKVWPVADPQSFDAIQVKFTCGYGAATAVPQKCKTAIKLLVGHLYEHREATHQESFRERLQVIPYGLDAFVSSCSYKEYA